MKTANFLSGSSIRNLLICPNCNRQKQEAHYLISTFEGLECSSCSKVFPIANNVPVLDENMAELAINAEETASSEKASTTKRIEFYHQHYSGRSRIIDLQSDYLLQERRLIKDFVQNSNITRVCLEVGCGTGIFAEVSEHYVGLDYSFQSVFSDGFDSYDRIIASAESIPLASYSVQLVFSFNTLEHIPEPELAFQEIDRVLESKGYAILKPAWHCTRYNTELLPIKHYNELTPIQKLRKFLIPLLRNKIYKFLTRVPGRIVRRVTYSLNSQASIALKYRKLQPCLENDTFISDCDATADLDCHEGILFFESRGYRILSHTTVKDRLLAASDLVIVQKP